MNTCVFSPDRTYRYSLLHVMDESNQSMIAWIGLNPSTADENELDPTLRRVRAFSLREGFGRFVMINLYAFRSTDPKGLSIPVDPVGPENDRTIRATFGLADMVVVAWGAWNNGQDRKRQVMQDARGARMVYDKMFPMKCLGLTKGGEPRHPLYVRANQPFVDYGP